MQIPVNRLRNIADEIIFVTGDKENVNLRDVRIVSDIEKNKGPMIGLFRGLAEIKNFY